ncbi:abc transporter [Lucifera butyrica]|uniref:Abc transporter n=1 Tax=Lucifera butyrica TaxID=1351585 RepID=A0A498REG1_9FIRM|nr:ABC transporter ATP-binding protein [Lucifera butyrica]VBB09709.1 abc transporter [Lucifera butyrica]
MRFFYRYARKQRLLIGAGVLSVTLEALCDLLQPTIMAKIIDVGVAARQMDYIIRLGGLMLFITAVGAIAASARNVISSRVSQRFGMELRFDLYKKIQSFSFRNLDTLDRASLVTRLTNDVNQVQLLVNGMMRISLKAPLLCLGSLIMATYLNPQLALVLVAVVPLIAIIIVLNMKIGLPFFVKVQTALDKVNGVMREYLAGVRVVKAFNRFDYETVKFNAANEMLQIHSTAAMRVMSAFSPGISLTVNSGIVVVLWLGGLWVSQGRLQVGHIIAFINYMTQILFSLMIIFMVFNMLVRARASAGRILEVFRQENPVTWEESAKIPDGQKGRVDFENVCLAYDGTGGERILKNINLTCLPGETVGIIGSTGSGKSSLVNLIPRFYEATSGVIKVGGVEVSRLQPQILRKKIAVVPQKTVLFTGTVADNIRWGKEDATRTEVEAAARMAEAHAFILSLPAGYQTKLEQGGVNLSGGQKQRVAIARALVRKPDILILDDCTSAVDAVTEARIREALKKYASRLTCLLVTQRITSVINADKIVVLDKGEIVGCGNHEALMKDCGVYRAIFQSQLGREIE